MYNISVNQVSMATTFLFTKSVWLPHFCLPSQYCYHISVYQNIREVSSLSMKEAKSDAFLLVASHSLSWSLRLAPHSQKNIQSSSSSRSAQSKQHPVFFFVSFYRVKTTSSLLLRLVPHSQNNIQSSSSSRSTE
ncbi:uncharacterized protein LOC143256311 isoform X2 [Tachypleus tridentatus]|uniref:uncharacterized protein LOC143256311 isoform X2 n=1 Tax=Tachypleus tridentatus TaxID=6853 RepID=UPI003FD168C4